LIFCFIDSLILASGGNQPAPGSA